MRKIINQKYPLVSVLVVNYNQPDYTVECLNSLAEQTYPNIEIILIENGSNRSSVKKVRKFLDALRSKNTSYIKQIIVLQNKTNLGFATPNNQAFEKSNGEYIFLLNNDAYIKKDTIEKAISYMKKNPKVGVVQNTILLTKNPGLTDSTGSFLTRTGFLIHEGHKEKITKSKKPKEVFSVKGASIFIKRKVIEKAGYKVESKGRGADPITSESSYKKAIFDPDYFAYFEETDFCWRAILAGFKVVYLPRGITFHQLGKTTEKQKSGLIQFHSFKNRLNSLIKNLSFVNLILILPLHLLIIIVLAFAHLFALKFSSFFGILRALLWNLVHLVHTLKKRSIVQKKVRSVKDSYIFSKLAMRFDLSWAINFTISYVKS
ncbi:glycosyltransferase family 2 protein [Candidatus Dojkabacteria bacterium]|nr:glycosyltransferase family 2 protein [Candidatus Dojkabacteria bacterium]